jgi:hypothetical protein
MIAAAQKVEHYEIASYGTIRTWANLLGKHDVAALMEDPLEEEKETDRRLTSIAESFVNEAATEADDDQEDATPARGRRTAAAPRAATTTARRQQAADRKRRAR